VTPTSERRTFRQGLFDVPLLWSGRGRPVLFLHGAWGLLGGWQSHSHLARLAEHFLVLAPSHPGFDGATGSEHLDDVLDYALYYLDLLDEMLVDSPHVIGHGLGAMIAAEMACLEPRRLAKLVLTAPYGLWIEGAPVADIFSLAPEALDQALWYDPANAEMLDRSDQALTLRQQNLAAAAKLLWPIPERGLRKRLHRLQAPTLLVWGERDGVVPAIYGEAFGQRIKHSRLVVIPGAAHLPHVEQPHHFSRTVLEFLEG
jgi:pimeloyl-ACP methyl ester carboxylesterase